MALPTQEQVTEKLRAVIDPELRRSIVELVERIAVKTGGHTPRRKRRYTPRNS